ncbi:arginase family protein [Lentibacillus sp. Marseille-P4043]|uniref:arginase family protein n=1 Tax=Lentibacillus sp. Marseille-P4043 TaxID=2040293 RepID=UPI000D0B0A0A|nr:arginase family protein [Lentibacillus sp. Marseille-P4043]
MDSNVTVLNFDQTYHKQSFLQAENCESLDFEQMPSTNLFCEKESLFQIDQRLRQRRMSQITFLGSGNYHYVSYLLLSEIQRPFSLVLFDHHTDMFPSPSDSLIACGSWVRESLEKLPMLKKVIIIGVNEDWQQQIPSFAEEKMAVYSKQSLHTDYSNTIKSIMKEIATDTVYISIDKDVLDLKEAVTAWDHGTMNLNQLMEIVEKIISDKDISGIDICGEYPISPTNEYNKRTREAVKKNERANRIIIEHLTQCIGLSPSFN